MSRQPTPVPPAKKQASSPGLWAWRRLCPAHWEDEWIERLRPFQDRLAITSIPGKKTLRIEAYGLSASEAKELQTQFGGQSKRQTPAQFAVSPPPPPIRVRQQLIVVSTDAQRAQLLDPHLPSKPRPVLLIPAGMAFGTGDHDTTATCLRLLADLSRTLPQPWEMLDLGCGTGILALAARILGAKKVAAADFDPDAVRVTKENCRLNDLTGVKIQRLDVREWTPERSWPVVVANLFSGVLIEAAAKIAAATSPGGRLIFSGVLRAQEGAVTKAFRGNGFRIEKVVYKGKWITGQALLRP